MRLVTKEAWNVHQGHFKHFSRCSLSKFPVFARAMLSHHEMCVPSVHSGFDWQSPFCMHHAGFQVPAIHFRWRWLGVQVQACDSPSPVVAHVAHAGFCIKACSVITTSMCSVKPRAEESRKDFGRRYLDFALSKSQVLSPSRSSPFFSWYLALCSISCRPQLTRGEKPTP